MCEFGEIREREGGIDTEWKGEIKRERENDRKIEIGRERKRERERGLQIIREWWRWSGESVTEVCETDRQTERQTELLRERGREKWGAII